jgi:hypothetical protein
MNRRTLLTKSGSAQMFSARHVLRSIFACLIYSATSAHADEWTSLFNGRDLDG